MSAPAIEAEPTRGDILRAILDLDRRLGRLRAALAAGAEAEGDDAK